MTYLVKTRANLIQSLCFDYSSFVYLIKAAKVDCLKKNELTDYAHCLKIKAIKKMNLGVIDFIKSITCDDFVSFFSEYCDDYKNSHGKDFKWSSVCDHTFCYHKKAGLYIGVDENYINAWQKSADDFIDSLSCCDSNSYSAYKCNRLGEFIYILSKIIELNLPFICL
jgi:hypothetical protein